MALKFLMSTLSRELGPDELLSEPMLFALCLLASSEEILFRLCTGKHRRFQINNTSTLLLQPLSWGALKRTLQAKTTKQYLGMLLLGALSLTHVFIICSLTCEHGSPDTTSALLPLMKTANKPSYPKKGGNRRDNQRQNGSTVSEISL